MSDKSIEKYILEYKDKYSKDSIVKQLVNSGFDKEDIERVYGKIKWTPSLEVENGMPFSAKLVIFIIGFLTISILIAGIFFISMIDFDSLEPNKVDLSNNLQGFATESFAFTQSNIGNKTYYNGVALVFVYKGAKRVDIDIVNSLIETFDGNGCNSILLRNIDTQNIVENSEDEKTSTTFINGQTGYMLFECENKLITDELFEGKIKIDVINPKTMLSTPSTGILKLRVN